MIGKAISHYRIIEKIGQGGMGEIYLAEDARLERQVALKFLPRHLTEDREARTRFEREAKAAAALSHPNIVTVYEIGEHEGQVFIAMEYVEGQTLKDLIASCRPPSTVNRLPISQVFEISTQICSGLAAAHAKGIVHRDIKPQNILVDKDNHVKILDFGLAKLKGISSLTKESSTLGTVHYMSPEQTLGKEVDQRTDIWSLGVVLFEMLTGRLPFKGDYEQAVIYSILNEEPKRATEIRQDIPPDFDRILEKALAKEPTERYQQVDDLLVDLKHLKKEWRPDHKSTPAVLRRKPHQWLKWAIPGAGILFAVITVALFITVREKTKSGLSSAAKVARTGQAAWTHSIAVLPFKNLSDSKEDEYFSDGITDDIIAQLSKISDLKVISRTSVMQFKGTSKSITEIGRELDVGTVLEGSVRHAGNQVRIVAQLIDARNEGHIWADTYDKKMIQIFAVQSDVAQKIAAALQAKLSPAEKERIEKKQTDSTEAYQLFLKGRFHWNKSTPPDFQKAIAFFKQAIEKDPSYALAYAGLASVYIVLPDFGFSTKKYLLKAEEAAARALEIDPALAEVHTVMGYIKATRFDWTDAENEYRRAIELNPSYPTAHHWYSTMLCTQSRFDKALTEIRCAVALDPLSLIINVYLGKTLYGMRQYDQAVEQLQKSVELDPIFPWSYYFLGNVHESQGKLDKAIQEYQKTGHLVIDYVPILGDLGRAYARAGRREDALQMLRELQKYLKQGYAVCFAIADVYYGLGDRDRTFEWLEKSIQDHEKGIDELNRPIYDDLRSDPRYGELLKKVGLEP
jgi:serine/threonine protein kinase/Flp pilus assembly protein TadD